MNTTGRILNYSQKSPRKIGSRILMTPQKEQETLIDLERSSKISSNITYRIPYLIRMILSFMQESKDFSRINYINGFFVDDSKYASLTSSSGIFTKNYTEKMSRPKKLNIDEETEEDNVPTNASEENESKKAALLLWTLEQKMLEYKEFCYTTMKNISSKNVSQEEYGNIIMSKYDELLYELSTVKFSKKSTILFEKRLNKFSKEILKTINNLKEIDTDACMFSYLYELFQKYYYLDGVAVNKIVTELTIKQIE